MTLTFRDRKPEKQLQHGSSRKHRGKTERQRPGERKRRQREMAGASAPACPDPQGRAPFRLYPMLAQSLLWIAGIKKPLPGLLDSGFALFLPVYAVLDTPHKITV